MRNDIDMHKGCGEINYTFSPKDSKDDTVVDFHQNFPILKNASFPQTLSFYEI